MEIRKIRPEEEREFLQLEHETIYPELKKREFQRWIEGEGRYRILSFVLEEKEEIVGGAVWEIQDHLGPTQIALQLDAIFIKEGWRRKGLGRQLFYQSLELAKKEYMKSGLKPVGILIQTTSLDRGAVDFYRSILKNFSYSEVTQKMDGAEVTVFLVEIPLIT